MVAFTYINIALLVIVAFIHLYWAMGGKRGITVAIPTQPDGKPVFNPDWFGAMAVAMALICFAYFHYACLYNNGTIQQLAGYFVLAGSVVFLLRAIGEMKYTGLFKKIKHTAFARYDARLYIPLSIVISACAFITFITYTPK